jgi:hypothetical protein
MQWLRAQTLAVRVLVALFLAAQFAGVVASPLAQAHAAIGAPVAPADDHHQGSAERANTHQPQHSADSHRHNGCAHPDACTDHADYCCALHAFFAGILPPVAVIDKAAGVGETLRPAMIDITPGLYPARLDRPPRPLS